MAKVLELRLHSNSSEATDALAESLGRAITSGIVICIDGDLGAGKTLFVKGLARGLGVREIVASPTYTLMQEYRCGRLPFFHFDAWMQGRERAFLEGGGEDYLHGEGITAIEWGGRVLELLPRPLLWIEMGHLSPEQRSIRIRVLVDPAAGQGHRADSLLRLLEALRAGPHHPQMAVLPTDGCADVI